MKSKSTRQFYLDYFRATKRVSWLARPGTTQRLKMLEELMQWGLTTSVAKE
ncbi:glucose uptake inhibitor SgrT [Salmonella enterica]